MRPRNIFRPASKGETARIRRPSHATIVAYVALVAGLTTGAAYAANTVGSADIIDGAVRTADLGASAVTTAKIANNAVTTAKIADGQVTVGDVGQGAVGTNEVINGELTGADVADNSLKGADIDESTLQGIGGGGGSLPRAVVAEASAAAGLGTLGAELDPVTNQVVQASLPNGNWVVEANATFGPNSAAAHNIVCAIFDGFNPLSEGNTHTEALTRFSAPISLTGVSDGGIVRLSCATEEPGAQVRDVTLVASEVGTVTGP